MNDSIGWRELLNLSHQALRDVTVGVGPDQWANATPCDQWSVTQVLQHAAGDQIGYASAITGGPGPSYDPFAPSGLIDGSAATFLESALSTSADAWRTLADDATDVPTPLPQGAMPASLAAGACALDAAVHAWDIAIATGQKSPLTDDMAKPLMDVATAIVDPLRAWGAYAAAIMPVPDSGPATALLNYLGRRV